MTDLPASFPSDLRDLAREAVFGGLAQLAWQYPTILEVVAALASTEYAILGGDVLHDEAGKLNHFHGDMYCGNWYLHWEPAERSWEAYVVESASVTVRYIEAYVQRNGTSYWYAPTFADKAAYEELLERRS
jgi:hypothetical protein